MSIDPRNVVIARISTGITDMLGAVGARATMRDAGRNSSDYIWTDWPSNLSPDEACGLLSEALTKVGIFTAVEMKPDGENLAIKINGCEFSRLGNFDSAAIGERSVCFFGFGLIERSLQRLTGQQFRVSLERHEASTGTCFEVAQLRR